MKNLKKLVSVSIGLNVFLIAGLVFTFVFMQGKLQKQEKSINRYSKALRVLERSKQGQVYVNQQLDKSLEAVEETVKLQAFNTESLASRVYKLERKLERR